MCRLTGTGPPPTPSPRTFIRACPQPQTPWTWPPCTMQTSEQLDATTEHTFRLNVRADLTAWAALALAPQGHQPAAHHRLIIRELEDLAAGRTDRLMLLLPPGSAKSTYASLVFPPWWLAQHPESSIIATSHTASLAGHFGRGVRSLIEQNSSRLGFTLNPANRAAHRFGTTSGAQYYASGVRGPIVELH